MNELAPQGHLRPLGGRENPRRARPESRSPRRCASAWRRCLLSAGRPEGIDQGTHDRHARARPHPQLHMRKGVNRNPSRRPELADSDSNLHAVKMTQNWALLTPPLSRAAARKSGQLGVPSFDCMQIRVADSQSRTPGWVSVNAFAHVQLRSRVRARVPVVCPLVDTFGAAREE